MRNLKKTALLLVLTVISLSLFAKHKNHVKGWYCVGYYLDYKVGVDSIEGKQAGYIESIKITGKEMGILMQNFSAAPYLGKRIRLSASIKTQNVVGWAGLYLNANEKADTIYKGVMDDMSSRPIKGTTGWKTYYTVIDVPEGSQGISIGTYLDSTGKAWMADVKLEVVDSTVPVTGKNYNIQGFTQWRLRTTQTNTYTLNKDSVNTYNGMPTWHLKALPSDKSTWGDMGKEIYVEKYKGKKIRITIYAKTQGLTRKNYCDFGVYYFKKKKMKFSHLIDNDLKPNIDWTKYECIVYIPENTSEMCYDIGMKGKGEMWVTDIKTEIVGDSVKTTDKSEKKYPSNTQTYVYPEKPILTFAKG